MAIRRRQRSLLTDKSDGIFKPDSDILQADMGAFFKDETSHYLSISL